MQRFLDKGGWIVLLPVIVPVVFLILVIAMCMLATTLACAGVCWLWHQVPRHRRALRLAGQTFATTMPGRVVADWRIARRERDKCFVQATLAGNVQPPFAWLCTVWDDEERIDDLGTWQFQHGVGVRHAARAYEASRAAGQPWPKGLAELVEKVPAEQLPAEARPGLHPHQGSVVFRHQGTFHFFAYAVNALAVLHSAAAEDVEAYDAECRRLHFRGSNRPDNATLVGKPPAFLAPFPPTAPDKVFIERLRHFLVAYSTDESVQQRLRAMSPPELVEFGLELYGDPAEDIYDPLI
jgi:hypothetical protein